MSRREVEMPIAGQHPDFRALNRAGLKSVFSKKLKRQLKPVFETDVTRIAYPLNNASVELALDRGEIEAGGIEVPVCEVELELKHGEPTELFAIAKRLADLAPLRLSLKSKASRGYELAEGTPAGRVVHSEQVELPETATTEEAFQAIAYACLHQIADNYDAVVNEDPNGIHQMRVGLRRLRAAISLFKEILEDEQTSSIKEELNG